MEAPRVLVYSHEDEPLFELDPTQLVSLTAKDAVNGEHSLSIRTFQQLEKEMRVFAKRSGRWREYVVTGIGSEHAEFSDRIVNVYYCVWSLQHDLSETYIQSIRLGSSSSPKPAADAIAMLSAASGRWSTGTVTNTSASSGWFYYQSTWDALSRVVEQWAGEVDSTVVIGRSGISRRIDFYDKMGSSEASRRFDYGYDMSSIKRTVLDDAFVCRIVPRGKGELVSDDPEAYGRRITIESVNDGIEYLEDAEAVPLVRMPDGSGGYVYPTEIVIYDQIDEPSELKAAALRDIQQHTRPKLSYEASVVAFKQAGLPDVSLGDRIQIVDSAFPNGSMRIEARVMGIDEDLLYRWNTKLTIGNFLPSMANDIKSLIGGIASAQESIIDADGKAGNALEEAGSASSAASAASAAASTANQTANAASQVASEAAQTANTANQTANSASQTATAANQTATAANQTATAANQTATAASQTAIAANQTASDALTKAGSAESSAQTAVTAAQEAQATANATAQHFWDDSSGVHVTEVTKAEWNNAGGSKYQSGYNALWNSVGLLFRNALMNLVSIASSAISFFDGSGNGSGNVVASFGTDGAVIGKTAGKHVSIDSDSVDFLDGDTVAATVVNATTYAGIETQPTETVLGETSGGRLVGGKREPFMWLQGFSRLFLGTNAQPSKSQLQIFPENISMLAGNGKQIAFGLGGSTDEPSITLPGAFSQSDGAVTLDSASKSAWLSALGISRGTWSGTINLSSTWSGVRWAQFVISIPEQASADYTAIVTAEQNGNLLYTSIRTKTTTSITVYVASAIAVNAAGKIHWMVLG